MFLLCAKDLYPFQIAEKEGFIDFSKKYLPTKCLPIRQAIVRACARVYQGVRNNVHEILKASDNLDWWKLHYGQFPLLAKLARCLFSIPATSAAIERVWSSSGLTITNRRSTLGPRNFKHLLFVHENYHFVKSTI